MFRRILAAAVLARRSPPCCSSSRWPQLFGFSARPVRRAARRRCAGCSRPSSRSRWSCCSRSIALSRRACARFVGRARAAARRLRGDQRSRCSSTRGFGNARVPDDGDRTTSPCSTWNTLGDAPGAAGDRRARGRGRRPTSSSLPETTRDYADERRRAASPAGRPDAGAHARLRRRSRRPARRSCSSAAPRRVPRRRLRGRHRDPAERRRGAGRRRRPDDHRARTRSPPSPARCRHWRHGLAVARRVLRGDERHPRRRPQLDPRPLHGPRRSATAASSARCHDRRRADRQRRGRHLADAPAARCSAPRSTTSWRPTTGTSWASASSTRSTARGSDHRPGRRRSCALNRLSASAMVRGWPAWLQIAAWTDADRPDARATANRSTTPESDAFKDYISGGWAERPDVPPSPREQAPFAAARRMRLSALLPGQRAHRARPARPSVRSNDTDYPYRAHSAFAYLTGWGSDTVPGSVLVLEPTADGHDATLYFRAAAGRDSDEFYANAAIGEFWTGPRPSLAHVAADLGLATRPTSPSSTSVLDAIDARRRRRARRRPRRSPTRSTARRCSRAADDRALDDDDARRRAPRARPQRAAPREGRRTRSTRCALAVDATKRGFDDVIADLPAASSPTRAASASSRAPSTAAPAPTATRSATTRSPRAGRTPASCTGPATTAPSCPATSSCSTPASSSTASTPPTSPAPCPVSGTFTDVQRRVYEAVLRGGGRGVRDRAARHPVPRDPRRGDGGRSPRRPPSGASCR